MTKTANTYLLLFLDIEEKRREELIFGNEINDYLLVCSVKEISVDQHMMCLDDESHPDCAIARSAEKFFRSMVEQERRH
jgi:hypothetical protein